MLNCCVKKDLMIDNNKIIILDEGKIFEIGKHKELLNSYEIYKEIALLQFSEEEINNSS